MSAAHPAAEAPAPVKLAPVKLAPAELAPAKLAPAEPPPVAPNGLAERGIRALRGLVKELAAIGLALGRVIDDFVGGLDGMPDGGLSQMAGTLMRCEAFILIGHAVGWAVALETRLLAGIVVSVRPEAMAVEGRGDEGAAHGAASAGAAGGRAAGGHSSCGRPDAFAQIARLTDAEVMAGICRDLRRAANMLGCPELAARVAAIAAEAAALLADPAEVPSAAAQDVPEDAGKETGRVAAGATPLPTAPPDTG